MAVASSVGEAHPRPGPTETEMPELTGDELDRHLKLLDQASEEELDELLTDFLVTAWPSRRSQDN